MPYPEGISGAHGVTVRLRCTNPDCDYNAWDVQGVFDMGRITVADDACPNCGEEADDA